MVKISHQNIAKKYPTTPVVYNLITIHVNTSEYILNAYVVRILECSVMEIRYTMCMQLKPWIVRGFEFISWTIHELQINCAAAIHCCRMQYVPHYTYDMYPTIGCVVYGGGKLRKVIHSENMYPQNPLLLNLLI